MLCIRNGTIHDGLGKVFEADILIENNKIKQISKKIKCNCEEIDATGKQIFPGFIDPMSNWGILGPGREIRGTADDNDEHSNPVTPEMDVVYAFDGRGITIQQLGAFGITSVGVAPTSSNLFGGMMAAFDVDGVNPYKMLIKEKIGMKVSVNNIPKATYGTKNIAPMTSMGEFALFEDTLYQAQEYKPNAKGVVRDEKKAAVKQVLAKKMPMFVVAENERDVSATLRITKKFNIDPVLCSGYGVTGCMDEIKKRKIALVVSSTDSGFDPNIANLNKTAIYDYFKQGGLVSLCSNCYGRMSSREDILWNGISMYKVGHDAEGCIQMMSANTAKVLGIDKVTGSLEKGKRADLVIWSDHPIKTYKAKIITTISNGKVIYKEGDEMKCFI